EKPFFGDLFGDCYRPSRHGFAERPLAGGGSGNDRREPLLLGLHQFRQSRVPERKIGELRKGIATRQTAGHNEELMVRRVLEGACKECRFLATSPRDTPFRPVSQRYDHRIIPQPSWPPIPNRLYVARF